MTRARQTAGRAEIRSGLYFFLSDAYDIESLFHAENVVVVEEQGRVPQFVKNCV